MKLYTTAMSAKVAGRMRRKNIQKAASTHMKAS